MICKTNACEISEIINLKTIQNLNSDISKTVCHNYLQPYIDKFTYDQTFFSSTNDNLPNISQYLEIKANLLILIDDILTDLYSNRQLNEYDNVQMLQNLDILKKQIELDQVHLLIDSNSSDSTPSFQITRASLKSASSHDKTKIRPYLKINRDFISRLQSKYTLTKLEFLATGLMYDQLSRNYVPGMNFEAAMDFNWNHNVIWQKMAYLKILGTENLSKVDLIKKFNSKAETDNANQSLEASSNLTNDLNNLANEMSKIEDFRQVSPTKQDLILGKSFFGDLNMGQEIELARVCELKEFIPKRNKRSILNDSQLLLRSNPSKNNTSTSSSAFIDHETHDFYGNPIMAPNPDRENYSFSPKSLEFLKYSMEHRVGDWTERVHAFNDDDYIYIRFSETNSPSILNLWNAIGEKKVTKYIRLKRDTLPSKKSRFEVKGTEPPNRISISLVDINGLPHVVSSTLESEMYAYSSEKDAFDTQLASDEIIEQFDEITKEDFLKARQDMTLIDTYYGSINF